MRIPTPLLPILLATPLFLAACDGDTTDKDGGGTTADADADGFTADEDCDDNNAAAYPGADELCDDIDNNCDGAVDEEGAIDGLALYADLDGDGFGDAAAPVSACELSTGLADNADDCDDTTDTVSPAADELCDTIDNDCDGDIDEDDAIDAPTWYADTDDDGDFFNVTNACSQPSGYVADDTDCDDVLATVNPGTLELCDNLDTDCDGVVGEVRVSTDYSSIQAAIDASEPESCIEAGTYTENLDFGGAASMVVEGAGGASSVTIDGGGTGRVAALTIAEADITLRGPHPHQRIRQHQRRRRRGALRQPGRRTHPRRGRLRRPPL